MLKKLVVIPTYNERKNIQGLIEEIFNLKIDDLDILVVDDNSPDKTFELVEELKKKYSCLFLFKRPEKSGLGSAYIQGFKYGLWHNYDLFFEMDADFSHQPEIIPQMIEEVKKGYHLIVGSRRIREGTIAGWGFCRRLMSWGAMVLARLCLGLKTKDVTSGFRCYSRETLKKINLDKIRSNGYAFQEEMLFWVEKKGFKVKEIPIDFLDRQRGQSKLSRKDIFEFFLTIGRLFRQRRLIRKKNENLFN